jgi:hypothetical protein
MALTNLHWPPGNTSAGGRLASALRTFESSRNALLQEAATFESTLSGNGTDVSHYNEVNTKYGFNGLDKAQAARNELLVAIGKVDSLGDAGNTVGTAAEAALDQLFTRLRA